MAGSAPSPRVDRLTVKGEANRHGSAIPMRMVMKRLEYANPNSRMDYREIDSRSLNTTM